MYTPVEQVTISGLNTQGDSVTREGDAVCQVNFNEQAQPKQRNQRVAVTTQGASGIGLLDTLKTGEPVDFTTTHWGVPGNKEDSNWEKMRAEFSSAKPESVSLNISGVVSVTATFCPEKVEITTQSDADGSPATKEHQLRAAPAA